MASVVHQCVLFPQRKTFHFCKQGSRFCKTGLIRERRMEGGSSFKTNFLAWEIWRVAKWTDINKTRWMVEVVDLTCLSPLSGQQGQSETDIYDQAVGRAGEWGSYCHGEPLCALERTLMYSGDDNSIYCLCHKTMRKWLSTVLSWAYSLSSSSAANNPSLCWPLISFYFSTISLIFHFLLTALFIPLCRLSQALPSFCLCVMFIHLTDWGSDQRWQHNYKIL